MGVVGNNRVAVGRGVRAGGGSVAVGIGVTVSLFMGYIAHDEVITPEYINAGTYEREFTHGLSATRCISGCAK